MRSMTSRPVRLCLAAAAVLLVAATATAQSEVVSPSVRFDKGLAFLKTQGLSLVVEYVAKEGASPTKSTIAAYHEMVQLANKKVDTTIILGLGSDQEKKVVTIVGKEMSAKGLGAFLWYKVCAAADKLEGCRSAEVIN